MWVVKLGGSLFRSDHLQSWLKLLAESHSLVVVPGGGPFADQVRAAQSTWEFDDATAHAMALLAMEQFGQMLCGLQSGLVAAYTPTQIHDALDRGETPVWMPSTMALEDSGIRQSWEVTSDSLAAWLCGELGAGDLLLVKSVRPSKDATSVEALTKAGIIDSQLGGLLQAQATNAWLTHAEAHEHLAQFTQRKEVSERGLLPLTH
jgi:aspartokinase-like uncharacterized kinase